VWDPARTADPPERWLRWAVVAAAVTTGVIVAALGTITWMAVSPLLSALDSGSECNEHDRRLTEQLAADPVLNELRPGLTRARAEQAAPCEQSSSSEGYAVVVLDADPSVVWIDVVAHYRGRLEAGGWNVAADGRAALLCADRRFGRQQVQFTLYRSGDSPGFSLRISFRPHGRDLGCG
jgi:hypothetical protein